MKEKISQRIVLVLCGIGFFFSSIRNGNLKRIRILLQNGFSPNLNFYRGITSLLVAVKYHQLEIVQVLIEYCADPNLADQITGFTPLIHSILEDDFSLDMIFVLIQSGAEPDQKDKGGMNPLHHCINEGKLEYLQFLLEKGADPTIQDKYGKTYLM
ncbi:ankyrin repeat protein [Leptospira noguchii]|uniref:Ankyrin repeat protein n=1 Tax=Leptospira noguchii TaxID=28182 RepID=M6VCC8_9LEPT|nr:ankyrin repeat protein [Leptospira noguchii]